MDTLKKKSQYDTTYLSDILLMPECSLADFSVKLGITFTQILQMALAGIFK